MHAACRWARRATSCTRVYARCAESKEVPVLRGERVGLRARQEQDVAVLQAELYDDVATLMRSDSRPWRPIASAGASPNAITDPSDTQAPFTVVELATDELLGEAVLW